MANETEPSHEARLSIGEVAEISGTAATTLRYYEKRGLIDPPEREGGKRRYDASVLGRLMVIHFCRIAGLGLDTIATVLNDRSANRQVTRQLATDHLSAIDEQIRDLELARRMMTSAVECICPTLEYCECGAMDDVRGELRQRFSEV